MPDLQPNPTGAGYFNAVSYGGTDIFFEIASNVSGNTPIGTLVEVNNYTGPGTTNPPVVATEKPSSTTADSNDVGVVTGGYEATTGAASIPPGAVAKIATFGVAQVLCDATTTAGFPLIQSAATAGAAKCTTSGAAPTNGQGIGVALQAVTISSGTALVWALLKPM